MHGASLLTADAVDGGRWMVEDGGSRSDLGTTRTGLFLRVPDFFRYFLFCLPTPKIRTDAFHAARLQTDARRRTDSLLDIFLAG